MSEPSIQGTASLAVPADENRLLEKGPLSAVELDARLMVGCPPAVQGE